MQDKESVWLPHFRSPGEYWKSKFSPKHYHFDDLQLEIDPDETMDDYEQYDEERQQEEIEKCVLSFPYFSHKYARILHPKRGLVPFMLFKYQHRVVKAFESHRWNIISKFRQGGLTTLAEIWGMWKCIFQLDQQILFLSKTDREAIAAGEIINRAVEALPSWLRPGKDGKWNDHLKQFLSTGGTMGFFTPEAARGRAATYLILDEAAFIPEMEEHWKAMYPVLSTGGNAIVISTVNGLGNWYEETYHGALEGKNKFNVIDLDYWEHPDYDDEEWAAEQKAQLGEKGWLQEVMRSFLGSGETYIPAHIVAELQKNTRENYPYRKRFQKFANRGEVNDADEQDAWEHNGALWLWKEPKEGHEYIMGVDASEGVGDEGDNSCIQIFDSGTLEQVGEFYSNSVAPYVFAEIVEQLGIYYNHALVVVENMSAGGAVLTTLQHDLGYDNLHFEPQGKSVKTLRPGIKVSVGNRSIILDSMHHRMLNNTIKVNSNRLVKELTTFVYKEKTKKIEAQKGKHDDAIMATCLALFVRDSLIREVPLMGGELPKEATHAEKSITYEEIRREILEGSPKDFLDSRPKKKDYIGLSEDIMPGVVFNFRRKNSKLLDEFGW